MSPSLGRVLPRYLNSVTCGSWADCTLQFYSATTIQVATLSNYNTVKQTQFGNIWIEVCTQCVVSAQ